MVSVASGPGLPDVVTFHTDATRYLEVLEAHHSMTHDTNGTRRVCGYLTEDERSSVSSNNARPCSTVARTRS